MFLRVKNAEVRAFGSLGKAFIKKIIIKTKKIIKNCIVIFLIILYRA